MVVWIYLLKAAILKKINSYRKNRPPISEINQIDFDSFWSYPKNYPSYLPKRDDIKYTNINLIEDYEFTNCIAFEMLIRTDEYKQLMGVDDNDIDDEWKQKMKSLGLDPLEALSIKNNPNPTGLFKGYSFASALQQDTSFITISDVDNGLECLIAYYLEKQEIFVVKEQKVHPMFPTMFENEYKVANKATINSVMKNLENYYIPCIPSHNNFHQDKCQLNIHLSIVDLETRFIQTIADKIPKDKNIKFYPIFKRPQLRFEESRIVELDINLDLPKKELVAYIEKVKDEYDSNSLIAKNVLDIVDDDQNNKAIKHPKMIRQSLADAFFCYDYYKAKKEYVENFNKNVVIRNDGDLMLQEKRSELVLLESKKSQLNKMYTNVESLHLLNEEIKYLQSEIEAQLEKPKELPSTNKKSKNYAFKDKAFEKSKINPNSAYNYYSKLAPFIDKQYYKHLLIGNR